MTCMRHNGDTSRHMPEQDEELGILLISLYRFFLILVATKKEIINFLLSFCSRFWLQVKKKDFKVGLRNRAVAH